MILVFGGTTEGRKVAAVCDEAAKPYYYSTKTNLQKIESPHARPVSGGMEADDISNFCRENGIRLIIDAGHPFAEDLHRNIARTAETLHIPVIRYERIYPERNEDLVWFDNYTQAVDYLIKNNIKNILALTGTNTISKLKPYWQNHPCWFRILDREDSRLVAKEAGFPLERIVYYSQGEDEAILLHSLQPQAIITKESGDSGGFNEKIRAALQLRIPVLVVKRPPLPDGFITVYGKNKLRKEIETRLPSFFELKTGYTTGTCATAATKAALIALLTGKAQQTVNICLPDGEPLELPIEWTSLQAESATCSVRKDAGDDPDITKGLEILSTVRLNEQNGEILFIKGDGVGTITLPGLGIAIGEPAINATPRAMIRKEVREIADRYECENGIEVCISVPQGKEIACRTFNPKLGIEGGISIIGTSGIVKPFSSEAFVNSIRREMQVAKALGCEHIVVNSGAKSERFVKQLYPDHRPQAFVHYGNFIGETLRIAHELAFPKLSLGLMIGKAVKLAEGALDTHSKKVVMNTEFIAGMAKESACSTSTLDAIRGIVLARQLWDIIPAEEELFFQTLLNKCYEVSSPLFPNQLEIILLDESGKTIRKGVD